MPKQASSITTLLSSLSSLAEANPSRPVRAPLRIHFPSSSPDSSSPTTITSPGTSVSKDAAALPPSYSISAAALSNITMPNCDLSPVSSHSSSSFSDSATGQHARRGSEASNSAGQIPHYLVVGLDLDPPFPSFPVLGPILHSLEADLRLETEELDADEGYVYLTADEVAGGPEGTRHVGGRVTKPVVGYMGPKPPGVSAPHRYVFLCWEQPGGVDARRVREVLGLGAEGDEGLDGEVGMTTRVRWDQEGFERKLGLGEVVAGNYFVC
ncbi:phosphatidylethanolamine-binding protein [Sordaria brevicollis]|uniref:Phosphatidylethanolamine-binding protein n=1 Tax=Sordaria brevicollis TaxID=83679 RepID=A0AAE0PHH6_SORBR|nr:phosphatidylethanolamine-binding protein [Sordaria brevicollis]